MRPTPTEVTRTAEDIFSRPEFQRDKSWLQRIAEWIARHLNFGDDTPAEGSTFHGGFNSAIAWTVIIVLAAVLVYVIWRLLRGRIRRTKQPAEEPVIEVEEVRSTAQWRSAAEDHEAAGEWKEALRCRYRELIGQLIDRRAISDIPGRTTGELRIELASTTPEANAMFDEACWLFELPWYADAPTGPEESRRFKELSAAIVHTTVQHRLDLEEVISL